MFSIQFSFFSFLQLLQDPCLLELLFLYLGLGGKCFIIFIDDVVTRIKHHVAYDKYRYKNKKRPWNN